jgi:hypothetical protein
MLSKRCQDDVEKDGNDGHENKLRDQKDTVID